MLHCGRNTRFMKNISIVLTTERSAQTQLSTMCHVQTIEEKINNFDYDEADLIALNADEGDHIFFNGQLVKN